MMNERIRKAAEILRNGGVLLLPTETVYGLICDSENPAARQKIYEMKHRSGNKPLGIFVPDIDCAEKLCGLPLSCPAKKLAEAYMPGPLTLIVPDSRGTTFGFRIPDHPFLTALLKHYGKALAQTSANLSGEPPALSVEQALTSLAIPPDFIEDGGILPENSQASTVVSVGADRSVKILREGVLKEAEIMTIVNHSEN